MHSLSRAVSCALLVLPLLSSCAQAPASKKLVIGLSLDTLKEERWQRDRDLFVARATELGATVDVQVANNDEARQAAALRAALTNARARKSAVSAVRSALHLMGPSAAPRHSIASVPGCEKAKDDTKLKSMLTLS